MLTRVISGIILVIILGVTMLCGGWVLFGATYLISLIGYNELIKATHVRPQKNKICGVELVGYIGITAYYILLATPVAKDFLMATIILTIMGMMLVYVFTFPKFKAEDLMVGFFGLFYVVLMLSYVYQVRMMPDGKYVVWLIFLCSWGCDTCAYLVGVMFGKHKMAPVLSPKKSIEGGIGGVVGAGLLGFLYATIFQDKLIIDNANIVFPIVCAVGAIISQIGDLCASGIKRDHEIKDYSKLIPGHGGILDRFDSVIITAPIIFYLILYIDKILR